MKMCRHYLIDLMSCDLVGRLVMAKLTLLGKFLGPVQYYFWQDFLKLSCLGRFDMILIKGAMFGVVAAWVLSRYLAQLMQVHKYVRSSTLRLVYAASEFLSELGDEMSRLSYRVELVWKRKAPRA